MVDTEEKLKMFKNKVCRYCNNNDCDRGIVVVLYNNQLQMRCCDYIPSKDIKNNCIEVVKYFERRKV